MTGTVDVLNPWLEANRNNVGGGQGVQDNTNIRGGESSLSSFDVPQRAVISYVYDLPFGKGRRFLGSAGGFMDKLVSGWGLNGITTFQSGFPLALTERVGLAFRAEFFNVFNRVQFSPPNTQPGNATFGQVTAQYNQPRLIQFGLRLAF
jgi:hypothetical protein